MGSESKERPTRVIQVSNISPTATREQIYQLFSFLGRIDEMKVYPSETNPIYSSITQKLAYIRYEDYSSVATAQHMTNSIFIDRALICVPVAPSTLKEGEQLPDEETALKAGGPSWPGQRQLPPNVINQLQIVGDQQVLITIDPSLSALGLPSYPSLPANTEASKIEEIRRTIYVSGLPKGCDPKEVLDFFNDNIGEIMYLRMAGNENLPQSYCYIEFSNQHCVPTALQNNGITFNGHKLTINHSRVAIIKPQRKTQDMAKKEVEEAMRVQNRNSGLGSETTHALNLGLRVAGLTPGGDVVPIRGSSPSFRRRSPSPPRRPLRRRSRSRSGSRTKRRRSRSRSKSKDRKRERRRSRSRERSKKRSSRSRSRSKKRSNRDRSRSRDKKSSRAKKSKSPSARSIKRERDKEKEKERKAEKEIKREPQESGGKIEDEMALRERLLERIGKGSKDNSPSE